MASSIIIAVVVAAFVLVLLLGGILYMLWAKSRRRAPLPPVQPLAHHRERTLHALQMEKERERSMYLSVHPSSSSRATIKSASAVSSESGSIYPPVPPGVSTANRQVPSRPISLASSAYTSTSSRVPHAPNSTVQIVLPAPLGSNIDYSGNSVADGWASQAISNDQSQPSRSRPRSHTQSLLKSHSRSQSSSSFTTSQGTHRTRTNSLPSYSVSPAPSKSYYTHHANQPRPPPVPPIPSMYTQQNHSLSRIERPLRSQGTLNTPLQNPAVGRGRSHHAQAVSVRA